MYNPGTPSARFQAGQLKFEVYGSREAAGQAAAQAAADAMASLLPPEGELGVIFATGASQLSMLHSLTSLPGLPWTRIAGFHMDEYEDISADHFASFRRYLREHLTSRVPLKAFHEIDGSAPDPAAICTSYAVALAAAHPQLCLLGIGENGHLAFNDPFVADFNDPADVRVVTLDRECRAQQVAEGWFAGMDEVPSRAITLTIPTLMRVPKLIVSVPGARKSKIVRRVIEDAITNACPATLLKTHPDATVYLEDESATELARYLS